MRRIFKSVAALAVMACIFLPAAKAQQLMGLVVQRTGSNMEEPLPGASVFWLGTTQGTTTRENGVFMIDRVEGSDKLVVSFVGFVADTITITDQTSIKVPLRSNTQLDEVTVEGWKPTSGLDQSKGINTVVMGEKELFKAACCNLAESFETNPAVDVSFTDAVTGTRQIQMLGLAGPNTMISVESLPGVRGLASSQGIQFIPGPLINSIEVTKGVGSVVLGYESISGALNVELKKPHESEKLFVNGYVNQSGRSEVNLNVSAITGKRWASNLMMHGSTRPFRMDQNNDGFLDFPVSKQFNIANRWTYNGDDGWLGQIGIKYLYDNRTGGEEDYAEGSDRFTTNRYGLAINTDRVEGWAKIGYQFDGLPYKNIGLNISAITHKHSSYYGFNQHDGEQNSVHAKLMYQSILGTTAHKFKTGVSFMWENTDETLANSFTPILIDNNGTTQAVESVSFDRQERIPGAFFEYTYSYLHDLTIIAGLRVDHHNLFGTIFTPRLHTHFTVSPLSTLRLSAGRGTRFANILAENTGVLASARQFVFSGRNSAYGYGYKPDQAWNFGASFSHDFSFGFRSGTLTTDYYYTTFSNQVVFDLDRSAREVNIMGLDGESFSHSMQFQLDYELARRFDIRLSYRLLDVKTTYSDGLLERPLIARNRAFANFAYETSNKWKFDFTANWTDRQRIPDTSMNPEPYRLDEHSPDFVLMNTQITKDFNKKWSAYLGVENISNYQLNKAIVAADAPFGPYFDSSLVWGPIFGRMVYAGFRFTVK